MSGSVLDETFPHVPSLPPVFAAEQARHVPPHGVAQQTVSMHCPVRHSVPVVQVVPVASFGTQIPATQYEVLTQPVAPEHVVPQMLPLHA